MLRNTRPIFDVVLDHRFSDPITRFVTVPNLTKCEEKTILGPLNILTSSSNRNAAEKQKAGIAMPLRNIPQQKRPLVITGDQHQYAIERSCYFKSFPHVNYGIYNFIRDDGIKCIAHKLCVAYRILGLPSAG